MREELKKIAGLRTRFRGTFERYGTAGVKYRFNGKLRSKEVRTLVLVDVTDAAGRPLTDHLWFKCGKQFSELELKPGERVEFTARVEQYFKRRRDEIDGDTYVIGDYCLKRPTKLVKLGDRESSSPAELPLLCAESVPAGCTG